MSNITYKIYVKPINLNVVIKNQTDNQKKKCYNYNKKTFRQKLLTTKEIALETNILKECQYYKYKI